MDSYKCPWLHGVENVVTFSDQDLKDMTHLTPHTFSTGDKAVSLYLLYLVFLW